MSKFITTLFLFLLILPAQEPSSFDTDIDRAYQNAKKGVYYALSNIPESKSSISSDLIDQDILVASIKLTKEVNGIKIESTGYFNTYSVEVLVYRSYDSLEKEGFR